MADNTDDIGLDEARKPAPTLRRILVAGMHGHDVARLQAELRRAALSPAATLTARALAAV